MLLLPADVLAQLPGEIAAATRAECSPSRPTRKLSIQRVPRIPSPIKEGAAVPSGCSFSPDGRYLAIARGPQLWVLEVAKGSILYEETDGDTPRANWPPLFSPKSDRLVYAGLDSLGTVELHQSAWKRGRKVPLPFKTLTIFPDPRTLAWSKDGSGIMLAEWGAGPHQFLHHVTLETSKVREVDCGKGESISGVSLDSSFAVSLFADGGYDTSILSDGKVLDRVADIRILAVSSDQSSWLVARVDRTAGARFPGEKGQEIEIWDAKPRRLRAPVPIRFDSRPYGVPCHAVFSADGSVLVTGDIKVVEIRDGRTGHVLHTIRHYEGDRVVAIAISPDGKYLLTMGIPTVHHDDDDVVLWELCFR